MRKTKIKSNNNIFQLLKLLPVIYFTLLVIIPFIFPKYFPWIVNIKLYLVVTILVMLYEALVYFFSSNNKLRYLWASSGYLFVLFNAFIIYITGGLTGPFIYVMVFIPITSISYLDLKISRNVGIFSVIALASLIFFEKSGIIDTVFLIKYIIHIATYGLITYFTYGIVKEVLLQKYEKEQYKKKLINLSEIDEVKQIFMTSMSHQLRTPLNGARWALDLAISDEKHRDLDTLTRGREKIIQAINTVSEMLKTAEFTTSEIKFKLNKTKISFDSLIKDILKNLEYLNQNKGVDLRYHIIGDVFIMGDRKMLDLAITNIIDNAFRYSPNGKVEISISKVNSKAKLIVKDSGIGIDPADLEYIFHKFYRGQNAMSVDPNESGVGLYSTKKIIELHGGTINLSSVLGKGTTVEVILPLE